MATTTRQQEPSSINLLPQEVQATQKIKRRFNIAVGAAIAVLLILAAITVMLRMQISNQEDKLREEQARAATLRTQVASLREFEVLEATVNQSRTLLQTALAGDVSAARVLDDLDTNIPADAFLSSLSVSMTPGTTPQGEPSLGTVQYSGTVRSFPGLANWLDTMEEIEGLRFVYLSNGSRNDQGVGFSATAHLTEAMLSGRCQQEGSQCP